MKYSLYKDLLDEKNILSHVFFNCADKFIEEIADKNEGKTKEQIERRKIDIELKIDGHICDPKKFFDMLFEQYSYQVREDATKIVKEQTSEKLSEIANKLDEFRNIAESLAVDINWNIDNPFLKTKSK